MANSSPQPIVLQPGQVVEGHEIIKPLGKGKFSIVYMAKRQSDGLVCAVKKINIFDTMQPRQRDKCLKEVRILQTLDHPNIIRLLDAIVTQHELLIIVEMAEKGDLKRFIRKAQAESSHFTEPQIWEYCKQLSGALDHMHGKRVMHRDIKPANIFRASDDSLKFGDLGLGRLMSSETMEAFSKVGTPLYMSPEVLHGAGYDMKSDIWSVGCVFYEFATLRSPFKSDQKVSLYQLFENINKGQYPPLPDTMSENFRALVDGMLLLKAPDRPSAADVLAVCTSQALARPRSDRQASFGRDVMGGGFPFRSASSAKPPPLMVMADIVEKLKLLDYEERLMRPRGYPFLHGCFFTHPIDLPEDLTQFEVLCELCRWILRLLTQRETNLPGHGDTAAGGVPSEPHSTAPSGVIGADQSAGPPCVKSGADIPAAMSSSSKDPATMPRRPTTECSSRRPCANTSLSVASALPSFPAPGADMGAGDVAAGGCLTPNAGGVDMKRACIANRGVARIRQEDVPNLVDGLLEEFQNRGLKLASQTPKEQFERGYGEDVCLMLNELINHELLARNFHFEGPVWCGEDHPECSFEAEEVESGTSGDFRDSLEEHTETSDDCVIGFASDLNAQNSFTQHLVEPPLFMTDLDADAWRSEVDRVKPFLQVPYSLYGDLGGWRSTISVIKELGQRINKMQASNGLVDLLEAKRATCAEDIGRVRQQEDCLNLQFEPAVAELSKLSSLTTSESKNLDLLQDSVTRLSQELSTISAQIENTVSDTCAKSTTLCDESALLELQRALRILKLEDQEQHVRATFLQLELIRRGCHGSQAAADGARPAYGGLQEVFDAL